ncbi:MAG: SUMF1/EgtB/PvdO family nonheme iron enzyme [Chloroflexi bacterium]|nr:SUMF1/EgtB/PvdO family nonheme iron enzyme [Chloroflexota bacterium]
MCHAACLVLHSLRIHLGAGLTGNETRVLRGGSWNNNQNNVRAACRNRNHPNNRNDNIGFRVVAGRHGSPIKTFAVVKTAKVWFARNAVRQA